jgi:tRNA-dihydrouridine synthase C
MSLLENEFRIEMAPMEGVVDARLREVYSKIGGIDSFVCEFIRVTKGVLPPKVFYRICPELQNDCKTSLGVPVGVQLLGGDPNWMAENALVAESLGAKRVDVNFGCPAKTVNKRDGGSVILREPQRVFNILSTMREALGKNTLLTAKIRLGYEDKSLLDEISFALKESGIAWLTVHGRTKVDGFRGQADWGSIKRVKSIVDFPVLANGDINSVSDYFKCREESGCHGVVLGRGLFSRPDLALQIRHSVEFEKNALTAPLSKKDSVSWNKLRNIIIPKFADDCLSDSNEVYALSRAKQWLSALSKSYPEANEVFSKAKRSSEIKHLIDEVKNHPSS